MRAITTRGLAQRLHGRSWENDLSSDALVRVGVVEAIERIVAIYVERNMRVGMFLARPADVPEWRERGIAVPARWTPTRRDRSLPWFG